MLILTPRQVTAVFGHDGNTFLAFEIDCYPSPVLERFHY